MSLTLGLLSKIHHRADRSSMLPVIVRFTANSVVKESHIVNGHEQRHQSRKSNKSSQGGYLANHLRRSLVRIHHAIVRKGKKMKLNATSLLRHLYFFTQPVCRCVSSSSSNKTSTRHLASQALHQKSLGEAEALHIINPYLLHHHYVNNLSIIAIKGHMWGNRNMIG